MGFAVFFFSHFSFTNSSLLKSILLKTKLTLIRLLRKLYRPVCSVTVLTYKVVCFKKPKMSPGIMATFVKNAPKFRSKIAQFGHTGQITLRETFLLFILNLSNANCNNCKREAESVCLICLDRT